MEAVIAALYLDGGLAAAQQFVEREIVEPAMPELRRAVAAGGTFSGAIGDHKSALQEYLQAAGVGQPQYVLTEESGPDHRKSFRVEVRVGTEGSGVAVAAATGGTKKEAQQEAARLAMERIAAEGLPGGADVAGEAAGR